METQNFTNILIVGMKDFLQPKDKGHGRVAFKVSSKFSSKKTPIVEIDRVDDIVKVEQALVENRLIAKRVKNILSPRGDIIISIREWDIIPVSDAIMYDNETLGYSKELVLVVLHNKETNITRRSCSISTEAKLIAESISVSGSGCNHEQFKLFLRKPSTAIDVKCHRHTSRGNIHIEEFQY